MTIISAIYPSSAGSTFDADYYVNIHLPFARRLFDGRGLSDIRVTIGVAALDGSPPPYWAISEMVFETREAFDTAIEACGQAIFADAANYTDVAPVLQVSTLAGASNPTD